MLLVHPTASRERFRLLAGDEFDEARLAEGALLIAQEEYPGLDVAAYIDRLDELASRVSRRGIAGDSARLDEICTILFDEQGLQGNEDDYYDPRNSYLNEVLDRGVGIPITLSIILVHVARSAGLEAHPVGLPGHFVVRCEVEGAHIWVDPYYGGIRRNAGDLADLAKERGRTLEKRHLRPWTARETLMRVLANLHNIYTKTGDVRRAQAARDRIDLLASGAIVN